MAAAVAVNSAVIHVVGGVEGWQHWLQADDGHFFVWRLCLYGATAYGWWWMRRRLLRREPSRETHQRLLRTEIAAVIAVVALEASQLLRHGGDREAGMQLYTTDYREYYLTLVAWVVNNGHWGQTERRRVG